MLTEEQILSNSQKFLELVGSIQREGMNTELLLNQIIKSDFFYAPASTKYHGAYKGGLCEHCLNVYENLIKLADTFGLPEHIDDNSLKIVALLHDFSKINFYVTEIKNKKVYHDNGSKKDSTGRYDWESYEAYAVKDASNRLTISNHESTAAFMVNSFIPLTFEEYATIENHHAGMSWDSVKDIWGPIYEKYKLALLLHLADMIDAFDERVR